MPRKQIHSLQTSRDNTVAKKNIPNFLSTQEHDEHGHGLVGRRAATHRGPPPGAQLSWDNESKENSLASSEESYTTPSRRSSSSYAGETTHVDEPSEHTSRNEIPQQNSNHSSSSKTRSKPCVYRQESHTDNPTISHTGSSTNSQCSDTRSNDSRQVSRKNMRKNMSGNDEQPHRRSRSQEVSNNSAYTKPEQNKSVARDDTYEERSSPPDNAKSEDDIYPPPTGPSSQRKRSSFKPSDHSHSTDIDHTTAVHSTDKSHLRNVSTRPYLHRGSERDNRSQLESSSSAAHKKPRSTRLRRTLKLFRKVKSKIISYKPSKRKPARPWDDLSSAHTDKLPRESVVGWLREAIECRDKRSLKLFEIVHNKHGGLRSQDLSGSESKHLLRIALAYGICRDTHPDTLVMLLRALCQRNPPMVLDRYYRRIHTTNMFGTGRTLPYVICRTNMTIRDKQKWIRAVLKDACVGSKFDLNRPVTNKPGAGNLMVASFVELKIRDVEWYSELINSYEIDINSLHNNLTLKDYVLKELEHLHLERSLTMKHMQKSRKHVKTCTSTRQSRDLTHNDTELLYLLERHDAKTARQL